MRDASKDLSEQEQKYRLSDFFRQAEKERLVGKLGCPLEGAMKHERKYSQVDHRRR